LIYIINMKGQQGIDCSKESTIIIISFGALIIYLLNMNKQSSKFTCVNNDNGAKQEEDALKLLGADFAKEGYVDYNQNLLTDYASEPYMVEPSQTLATGQKPIHNFHDKLINNTLTYEDLDLNYPGAVELDQIESQDFAWMGHVDAPEQKIGYNMPGDVTFDLNRTKGNDDIPTEWSNDGVLDGDEQIVDNMRSRALNANVRSDMGTIRRKEFMERFVQDELDEFGQREWWGRADY
jgi:hypothetical protein